MDTDHETLNKPAPAAIVPEHLNESHPPKVQKAHIRKRLGDIDLQIVQLQNEKKDLRELHSSLK
jgi:hypothetical protein